MSVQQELVRERPDPVKLLHYNEKYRVLICMDCGYAIQPTAIARHLKELHHLYRSARRPYLEYIRDLRLANDIPVASIEDFPVPHLTLYKGFKCESSACDYLCLSAKRMEMHWPAVHKCKGEPARDWSRVPLQTFFRGTMVQYFAGPRSLPARVSASMLKRGERQHEGPGEKPLKDVLRDAYQLDDLDTQTLEHYFSTTHKCFMIGDGAAKIWLSVVPDLACRHGFILFGLLAFTAQHMSYCNHPRRSELAIRAFSHKSAAFPAFRNTVSQTDQANAEAILVFAYLLIVMSLGGEAAAAAGPDGASDHDPFLLVRTSDSEDRLILPQWLHLLRSGCSILEPYWDAITKGPVRMLAEEWERGPANAAETHPSLERFLSFIPEDGNWSDSVVASFRAAAKALAFAYAIADEYEDPQPADTSCVQSFSILARMPLHLTEEFLILLSSNHPAALLLMAWYCVLLKRLDRYWYFEGRAERMFAEIERTLEPRWLPLIQDAAFIVRS